MTSTAVNLNPIFDELARQHGVTLAEPQDSTPGGQVNSVTEKPDADAQQKTS